MSVTSRERVRAAVAFERPDRLPRNDSPWKQTVERWWREGLPEGISPAEYFDWDIDLMYIDPSPRFAMNILERRAGYITYEDRYGYTMRKEESGESTIGFLHHRTLDRDTWEREIRPRLILDPNEPARLDHRSYFGHFDPYPSWEEAVNRYRELHARNKYLLFMVYGPWEATWRHRGMEELLLDTARDPEWVEDMARAHVDLVIAILEHCGELRVKPDGILLAEDLGCNSGPLFSPRSWDRIFRPHMERLGESLRRAGITFWMHSDGKIELYLERLIEVGVEVLNPLDVQAGMDAPLLRQRLGKRLAFHGNISTRAMAGTRGKLEEELARKIPLAREGGFIMHSDHSVPPDVSFEQYAWMQRRAQEIFEGR